MTKQLRDFYMKNEEMRAFLNGVEKKDEKLFITAMVGSEFEPGERVLRKNSMDRCLLIVAGGSLLSFTDEGENLIYEAGAILGVEQFLFNRQWSQDLICGRQAIICKLKYEALLDMIVK
jgi:signal-transduction protein with cAMP-binding, CBS, and nucleotidyltransferase domain